MVNSSNAEPARRKMRLARETALLEVGRADIRAGRCLSGDALEAWLEGLGTALPTPDRFSGRTPP